MGVRLGAVEDLAMSAWKDRAVFVTGATGLLGSHLAETLLERGARVVALVRDHVPDSRAITEDILSRCVVVRGELEDYFTVLRALNEHEIETVFHVGAQTIVGTAAGPDRPTRPPTADRSNRASANRRGSSACRRSRRARP